MAIDAARIHCAKKIPSLSGDWVEEEGRRLSLVIVLEIEGVTIEGLLLRGSALKNHPDEAVTFQLEFAHEPGRRDLAVDRIDWRPLNEHTNGGKGPKEFRYLLLAETHHHAFDLNWLPDEGRLRKSNLPIAQPVNPDLADFDKLVEFVKKCFRIIDLEIPVPPWEADLL